MTNDLSKATDVAYTARGELARTWGAAAQPTEYGYDDYGQRTSLKTWRTLPASNGLWTDDEWPGSQGAGDETMWTFDAATGLLTSKIYAGATHVDYAHTADERLRERTGPANPSGRSLRPVRIFVRQADNAYDSPSSSSPIATRLNAGV